MPQRKVSQEERDATGRKSKKDAPQAIVAAVDEIKKPADMSVAASKYWDTFVPDYGKVGLLAPAQAGTIATLCEVEVQLAAYRKKFQTAKNHKTKHGNKTESISIEYKVFLSLSKESTRLQDQLGISAKALKGRNVTLITNPEGEKKKGVEIPDEVRKKVLGG